jgi:hypothetical protein
METDVVEIRVWTDLTTRMAITKAKDEHYRNGWTLVDVDYGSGLPWMGGTRLRGTQVVKLYFQRVEKSSSYGY